MNVDGRVDRVGEVFAHHGVYGKEQFFALCLCFCDHLFAVVEFFVVHKRSADLSAIRFQEGVRHAAADDQRIAFFKQVGNDVQFVGDLCAAQNRNEGMNGVFERIRHHGEFFFDEEATGGGLNQTVFHDRRGGSMRAVRGAECVVHVNVAVGSKFFAEIQIFLFLFPMEPKVFKQYAFALFTSGNFRLRIFSHNVGSEGHFSAEQFVQTFCDGRKSQFFGFVLFCFFNDRFGSRFARVYFLLVFLVQFHFVREDGVRFAHVRAERDFCALFH